MSNDVTKVSTGKPKISGAIFRAPITNDLVLPTDPSTDLDAKFKNLGYISDEGLSNDNSPESDNIKAWGGDVVLTYQTGKEDNFKFTMIESMREEVLKAVYGDDNVETVEAVQSVPAHLSVASDSSEQPECAWVIDMVLRGGKAKRIVIPRGKITELDEIKYTDEDVIGYGVTVAAMPDASGKTHYEYMTA